MDSNLVGRGLKLNSTTIRVSRYPWAFRSFPPYHVSYRGMFTSVNVWYYNQTLWFNSTHEILLCMSTQKTQACPVYSGYSVLDGSWGTPGEALQWDSRRVFVWHSTLWGHLKTERRPWGYTTDKGHYHFSIILVDMRQHWEFTCCRCVVCIYKHTDNRMLCICNGAEIAVSMSGV